MARLGMIMRSEQEMLALIIDTAKDDERIRAAILNGSRANPNANRDVFQDYDVVFIVADPSSFKKDPDWIQRFGDLMILQMPDDMHDPPPGDSERFAYLMQFMDGNRIDLTIYPIAKLDELETDSLSLLLLDKDGIVGPLAPASEKDYLPRPPTAKAFSNCCNEFWWVSPYVAKGLWREEITYAQYFTDGVRGELMKMLAWHIGINTRFARNLGKHGKYFHEYLEPELWDLLQKTYSDAAHDHAWDALFAMGSLFRRAALSVAKHFNFEYPLGDDQRVSAYLEYIRTLPKNAREMD
jgi:aminoglycoside 6-adenylyltransferase